MNKSRSDRDALPDTQPADAEKSAETASSSEQETGQDGSRGTGNPRDVRQQKQWISKQLRSAYDEVLSEPVPDRLAQLLEQLKSKESDA